MNAGGGLFRHALDGVADGRIEAGLFFKVALHHREQRLFFLVLRVVKDAWVLLGLGAKHAEQGGVAAIIEDQVGIATVRPFKDLVGIVPIFDQIFALEGKDRRADCRDGSRSMVLGREDVARGPAHIRAEGLQGFDQHGGLDGHVQGSGDPCALERLGRTIFLARGHQARHFGLSNQDFLAAKGGEGDVGNDIVGHGEAPDGNFDGRL